MSAPSTRPPSLSGYATYLSAQVSKGAARLLGERLAPFGVRTHHLAVLAALGDFGPQCQQDLCDRLDLDKSHMVGFVDDLEGMGHLERTRDPVDRRRHRVAITTTGNALLADLLEVDARCQAEVFAALDAGQRGTLVDLLARVVADLDVSRLGADRASDVADAAGRGL